MTPVERYLDALDRLRNLPYLWGGDDPMTGFDCSGVVVEGLTAAGVLSHGSDYTAPQLWDRFEGKRIGISQAAETKGALLFYANKKGEIIHVETSLGDGYVIGAIGGGQATTSPGAAEMSNAFVKIRPYGYRGAAIVAANPFKE